MNCLLYSPGTIVKPEDLFSSITEYLGTENVFLLDTLEELFHELVSRKTDTTLVLLMIQDRSQLDSILQQQDLFADTLVLVSIWQAPELIDLCFQLKPRLICTTEEELSYVLPMLKRIQEHHPIKHLSEFHIQ